MRSMHFEVRINAPVDKVWKTMLEKDTYKVWTEVFSPGSYYEGSWAEGSKIRFLSPSGEGMVSIIAENRKYEFISIKHKGFIKNGIEDTESPEALKWAQVFENYTFTEENGAVLLKIDLDKIDEEFVKMFDEMWPKALDKLKQICEKGAGTRAA